MYVLQLIFIKKKEFISVLGLNKKKFAIYIAFFKLKYITIYSSSRNLTCFAIYQSINIILGKKDQLD